MPNDQDNEDRLEGETSQQQNQQPSAQQGQRPQQAEFSQGNRPNPGFEPSDTDTLSQSEDNFGQSDGQSSGFIGLERAGSDDYRHTEGQGDLASEDALDSEEDGGAGMEGGQSR